MLLTNTGLRKESTPEDVAPSEMVIPTSGINPLFGEAEFPPKVRALTIEEIHVIKETRGDAAVGAKEAGFDALELQAVEGNLLVRFTSPFANRRKDEYGGALKNQTRLLVEAVANIKGRVGKDFPLICRIAGIDLVP